MLGAGPKNLTDRKKLVTTFLVHCNNYADGKLSEYRAAARAAHGAEAEELADKIHDWSVYKRFNEHTIDELKTAMLDDWLSTSSNPPE